MLTPALQALEDAGARWLTAIETPGRVLIEVRPADLQATWDAVKADPRFSEEVRFTSGLGKDGFRIYCRFGVISERNQNRDCQTALVC